MLWEGRDVQDLTIILSARENTSFMRAIPAFPGMSIVNVDIDVYPPIYFYQT